MGSGCTKAEDTNVVVSRLEKEEVEEEEVEQEEIAPHGEVIDTGRKGLDCLSLHSTSSTSSRPPTPFSRPVTATVIQRPKTTTISERAELHFTEEEGGEEVIEEVEEETPAPPKLKRTASRNGGLDGLDSNHRNMSRHIAEDDEDIIKMKEYMEQKGL